MIVTHHGATDGGHKAKGAGGTRSKIHGCNFAPIGTDLNMTDMYPMHESSELAYLVTHGHPIDLLGPRTDTR